MPSSLFLEGSFLSLYTSSPQTLMSPILRGRVDEKKREEEEEAEDEEEEVEEGGGEKLDL